MAYVYVLYLLLLLVLREQLISTTPRLARQTPGFSAKMLKDYKLVSTYLSRGSGKRNHTSRNIRSHDTCYYLRINIQRKLHEFCVMKKPLAEMDIASADTKIVVLELSNRNVYSLRDLDIFVATGYEINHPYSSAVYGYIEGNSFFGKLYVNKNIYYVEQITKFPTIMKHLRSKNIHLERKLGLLYETKNGEFNSFLEKDGLYFSRLNTTVEFEPKLGKSFRKTPVEMSLKTSPYAKQSKKGTTSSLCSAILMADSSFYLAMAEECVNQAVNLMVQTLAEVDAIFRPTDFDFDGIPDNIGFSVHRVIVLTSKKEKHDILPGDGNKDPLVFLEAFGTYTLDDACVGVIFTYHTFVNAVMGLSFVAGDKATIGGICQRRVDRTSHNALAVTWQLPSGDLLPQKVRTLNLAHELGHMFGAFHDDEMCEEDGVHIMHKNVLKGEDSSNYKFSSCSRRMIARVLEEKGVCLRESHEPFCGNGLLEDGEECDCGHIVDCIERDACCVPRGSTRQCLVNREEGFQCHPSQSVCCNDMCQYNDFHHLGMNCNEDFNDVCSKSHLATRNETIPCGVLGLGYGACSDRGGCHSVECTRLDLTECTCDDAHTKYCVTCCSAKDGRCLPALNLTDELAAEYGRNQSGGLWVKLRQAPGSYGTGNGLQIETVNPKDIERIITDPYLDGNSTIISVRKTYCVVKDCVTVFFRIWKTDSLCVANGHSGVCNKGSCDIKRMVRIFPSVAVYQSKASLSLLSFFRLLSYVFFHYFIAHLIV